MLRPHGLLLSPSIAPDCRSTRSLAVCELVSGSMEWIYSDTRYSPPLTFSAGDPSPEEWAAQMEVDERKQRGEGKGAGQSRPRVCTIEKYGFKLVCESLCGAAPQPAGH